MVHAEDGCLDVPGSREPLDLNQDIVGPPLVKYSHWLVLVTRRLGRGGRREGRGGDGEGREEGEIDQFVRSRSHYYCLHQSSSQSPSPSAGRDV